MPTAASDEQLREHLKRRSSMGDVPAAAGLPSRPTVAPVQLPHASPPPASPAAADGSSSHSHGSTAVSDSSELMFEEQLRVAAIAVAELQQLVQQRRKGGGSSSAAAQTTPQQSTPARPHTSYTQLTPAQADSLTSHLLLTSHTLLHQLSQQWSLTHRQQSPLHAALPPPPPQCHDPSPLPLSLAEQCMCRCRCSSSSSGHSSGGTAATSHAEGGESELNVGLVTPGFTTPTKRSVRHPHAYEPSPATSSDVASSPFAAAVASPVSPSASPAAAAAAPVRRTVLPFQQIAVLEQNILAHRTARGQQLKQKTSTASGGTPGGQQQQQQQAHGVTEAAHVHLDNGTELVHPRDIALLQQHFMQLLTPQLQSPAAISLTRGTTPLALCHPFALLMHELHLHFRHQLSYIREAQVLTATNTFLPIAAQQQQQGTATYSLGEAAQAHQAAAAAAAAASAAAFSAAALPVVRIDAAFVQSQLQSLFSFLSAHETLIVLSYPHLHATSLCKRVLRSSLRAALLNTPLLFRTLHHWCCLAFAHEDAELAQAIQHMRQSHVGLREIGLQFPQSLCASSLVHPSERAGEGVRGFGASSVRRARGVLDEDEGGHEEEEEEEEAEGAGFEYDAFAPVDALIHSDGEEDESHSRSVAARRRGLGADTGSGSSSNGARRGGALGLRSDEPQHIPREAGDSVSAASFGMRRNHSANALTFLSSSPRMPVTTLSQQPPSYLAPSGAAVAAVSPGGHGDATYTAPSSPNLGALHSHSIAAAAPIAAAAAGALTAALTPLPYARSIHLLSGLDALQSVDAKLERLVAVCRCITQELHEFMLQHGVVATAADSLSAMGSGDFGSGGGGSASSGSSSSSSSVFALSCDDLFQIFAFCLLHSSLSTPVATMNLLAECIEGSALNGEVGYCLTTMQCSVQLILGWKEGQMHANEGTAQGRGAAAVGAGQSGGEAYSAAHSLSSNHVMSTSLISTSVASSGAGSHYSPSVSSSSFSSLTSPSSKLSLPALSLPSPLVSLPDSSTAVFSRLLASALDAFCIASDYLSLDSSWQWLYEKSGVTVLRKRYDSSPICSIKGQALIARPPAILQAFVSGITNRAAIDELYMGGKVLQHLSPDTKIVTYRFRARNWCARQQTDMVLLLHHGVCSDGVTLLTLAFSLSPELYPYPLQPGFSRATLRASGWLFKPTSNGAGSHVTYLVSPDGNGFPSWIVNLLSSKQPMLIANLREHMLATTPPSNSNSSSTQLPPPPSPSFVPSTPPSTNGSNARRLSAARGVGPNTPV